MGNEELQKQVEERIAKLPEDIQLAIASNDLGKHIQTIGQRHQLHIDQMEMLQDEVMLVMLGFVNPEDFTAELQEQVRIPVEKAHAITTDIQNEIFTPVRESMKSLIPVEASATPAPLPTKPPEKPAELAPNAEMHPADIVLTQKTVSMPPIPVPQKAPEPLGSSPTTGDAPKPAQYKTDPYREPAE